MSDLELRGVALLDRPDLWDVSVAGGRITSVHPADPVHKPGPRVIAVPGFIDSHLHLEKAFVLDRMPGEARTLVDAIRLTAAMKPGFTADDIRRRSLEVIDRAVVNGVTRVRAHVEIDDVLGLTAMETALALRAEVAGRMDLQVVAFPQEGILSQRRGRELMRTSMRLGADAVGGIPYAESGPDVSEHLDFVFELAERYGRPLDFHIDFSDDVDQRDALPVLRRIRERRFPHTVVLGHLTSLGSIPRSSALRTAGEIAEVGASVVTLPVTDVFLNGRDDEERPRRGLTPVRLLQSAGVNVAMATNNIQNPFTPFGRGNILDVARLFAVVAQFGTAEDATEVLRMITTRAATAVDVPAAGLVRGAPADITVFAGASARDVLNGADYPLAVYRAGSLVAQNGVRV